MRRVVTTRARAGAGPWLKETWARRSSSDTAVGLANGASKAQADPQAKDPAWYRMRDAAEGVTIVDDEVSATRVLDTLYKHKEFPVAWDTETQGVDPTTESPVGKGTVICASAFGGMDFDYFADPQFKKIWHNYSFDRHVMKNTGIICRGLEADTMHMARLEDTSRPSYSLVNLAKDVIQRSKISMKDRFGYRRELKNGNMSKELIVPPTQELHRSVEHIRYWIEYACDDAEFTWQLRNALQILLAREYVDNSGQTLHDVYQKYMVPFADLLVDMEDRGFKVDKERLAAMQGQAGLDRMTCDLEFRRWASKRSPDAIHMNTNSDKQKQFLFFAPLKNTKTGEELDESKEFEAVLSEEELEQLDWAVTKPKSKKRKVVLKGLGLPPAEWTSSGWPSVSQASVRKLLIPQSDAALKLGTDGCDAVSKLLESSAVSTLLTSFMMPLQAMADSKQRIHASLNLNTETGRLSCRRPNLQNQPALEKDLYKIRDCFTCEDGNSLIVADYGQLELRLMAHLTRCHPMIEAFERGGDFHSRTAVSMYPYIQEAIDKGEVRLEGGDDGSVGTVKEEFGIERRRAKTLNFSIAYGKTAVGLAKDWRISVGEAKETVERWYAGRPGVRAWQEETKQGGRETGYVTTLLGRRRHLPDIRNAQNYRARSHAERAAINAPLQGSAADVVMAAMLRLGDDEELRELGWHLILQIHDEIILEGPTEHAGRVGEIVRQKMENPLGDDVALLVELLVDLKTARTWYQAK